MINCLQINWKILMLLIITFPSNGALLFGQIEVEPATFSPFEPENLIKNVFLGKGIEVLNIQFKGKPEAVGFFSNGTGEIGIKEGLVMTTGQAFLINREPNNGEGQGDANESTATDETLEALAGRPIADVAVFEIEFIPLSDTIEFNYAFASEEYPEFGCDCFNDLFGFFLKGPGFADFTNIGIIPGTNDAVSVNNIHPLDVNGDSGCSAIGMGTDCAAVNEQYYNDNTGNPNFFYDGYTNVFTAKALVTPCQTYTIKLAIADVRDDIYDSAVFFEGRSFGSNALAIETATVSLDGTIVEGCAEGVINFSIPKPRSSDLVVDYNLVGNAVNGTDYELITPTITILAGDTLAKVVITALEDNMVEGLDSVGVKVAINACDTKTFWTYIRDNELVAPDLGIDQSICADDQIQLDGSLTILLEGEKRFNSPNQNYDIPEIQDNAPAQPGLNTVEAEIEVIGVQPFELEPDALKEVCIILFHRRVDELDIYLETPNGRFIELTTDNGGAGNDFSSTCFTPNATQSITDVASADAPFMDNYLPEGDWTPIWESGSPTNGTWKLYLKDDQVSIKGVLTNWWITFNPTYHVNYEWEAADSISCLDCPFPFVNPIIPTQYKITATDSYGCTVTDSIMVNISPELAAPNATCGEITDNSIAITWEAVSDARDYSVNVNNTGWEQSNVNDLNHLITGLVEGDSVEVQIRANGNNNCGAKISIVNCTTAPCVAPNIILDSVQNVGCKGGIDGAIFVSADIDDAIFVLGTDTSLTGRFNPPLRIGTYIVKALSANKSCEAEIEVKITEPERLSVLPNNVIALSCFESSDGLIDVTTFGGTAPYKYTWITDNIVPDTNVLVNISAGDYFLSVTDANNCSQTLFIPILQPEQINITSFSQDESCFESQDGKAAVTVNGGIGNVNIFWNTNESTDTISNLPVGNYMVSITDDQGCGDTLSFVIDAPLAINLTTFITETSCSGMADGAANVVAQGGVGNFTFLWNDSQNQTTATATTLSDRIYQVIATDQTGCSDSTEIEVTAPNPILIDTILQGVTCSGGQDGMVTLTIAGGTPNYTLNWSDVGILNGQNRSNLTAGDYVVTITDIAQCSKSINFSINSPNPISINLQATTAGCGLSDGTITAEAFGGDGNYSFQWDDIQNQITPTALDLKSGNYSIIVTDSNDCTSSESIEVEEHAGIELTTSATPVFCKGDSTGSATVVATGGSGNFLYLWDDSNTQETPSATKLIAGDYMILVLDDNGCERSISVTVEDLFTPIEIVFSPEDIACFGEINGAVNTLISGGNPNYSYAWSSGQNNANLSNISAGNYLLTITDDKGCKKIDSVSIIEPEELFVDVVVEEISCPGNGDGQIQINPIGGTSPYEFSIDDNRFSGASQFSLLLPGLYTPTIRDANNCSIPLEPITLEEAGELSIMIEDISIKLGEQTLIKPEITNGSGDFTFIWSGNNLTDLSCIDCPAAIVTPTNSQNYIVQIIDVNGCEAKTSFKVLVEKNRNIYVPTGFSPNDDGTNDRLTVHGPEGTSVLTFKIFDRWGELVFTSSTFQVNDKSAGWDGKHKGKALNTNVFAWLVEVQYADGKTTIKKGHSTLIR